jgi:hypothetical protein
MPDNLESLCDLAERRAVEHRKPLARLFERVFAAIRDGKLDFAYPDEFERDYGSLKHRIPLVLPGAPDDAPKTHIEILCTGALRAIENGDAFDPWKQPWVQRMLVSAAAFDRELFPADQKRRPGARSLAEPLANFIKSEFPNGVPRGLKREEIARRAKDAGAVGRVVNPKTVTEAIKLLGGRN